jgi:SAM-dependent methyltransferase
LTSWEREADNWVRWARTPGHDVFANFAPSFFQEIVPQAAGRTLEIGCGEGRMSRELAARRHNVLAIDASPTLVRHARASDARSSYVIADATALPFADDTFTTVVAYNSLQTMDAAADMARAVREASRVLERSGHFCFCVAHPMTDAGRLEETSGGGDLVISGSYFDQRRVDDTVTKADLSITFHGWTYALQDYSLALEAAGLVIDLIREPVPLEEQASDRPGLASWRRTPLFLFMRGRKAKAAK